MPIAILPSLIAGITLNLTIPAPTVRIGEPLKVVVAWSASSGVSDCIVESTEFSEHSLEFVVNGATDRRYVEYPHGVGALTTGCGLEPGHSVVLNYVLIRGWYVPVGASADPRREPPAPAFSTPGRYALEAVYVNPRNRSRLAVSNEVTVDVVAPDPADGAVLDLLGTYPHLLEGIAGASVRETRELLRKHWESPYLCWAKVRLFEQLANEINNNRDPETGDSFYGLPAAEAAVKRGAAAQQLATQIGDDGSWGPFEEERLWFLARAAYSAGDTALQLWAMNEIESRFPDSMAAARVEEWKEAVRRARAFDAGEDMPVDKGKGKGK